MKTPTDNKVTDSRTVAGIDWASKSDAELGYQFDCFELHEGRIPKGLQRELDKRNAARENDPLGSVEAYRLSERIAGA